MIMTPAPILERYTESCLMGLYVRKMIISFWMDTSSKPTSYAFPALQLGTSLFGKYMLVVCQDILDEIRLWQMSVILSFGQLSIETLQT